MIERSEHAELIATNKIRHDQNKTLYRRRQAIVEHPYGTIKRQWGFNYIITKKTIKRAEADVGLIFTAYNLRRILNIIGIEVLRKYFLLVVMLKRAFFSSLEAFWQQKILITKIVTQKQTMLRNKIFANFRQLFYGKLNYSGGY